VTGYKEAMLNLIYSPALNVWRFRAIFMSVNFSKPTYAPDLTNVGYYLLYLFTSK